MASGLKETLRTLPSIRSFYGIGLFSCIEGDGSHNRTVLTNALGRITDAQDTVLAERGVHAWSAARSTTWWGTAGWFLR